MGNLAILCKFLFHEANVESKRRQLPRLPWTHQLETKIYRIKWDDGVVWNQNHAPGTRYQVNFG